MHGTTFFNSLSIRHLPRDLAGGITTAVVALPLALAFGVASGAGPAAGVYGAIFVGFFAALFGGTPAQVSGPTGPMTVVMAGVFTSIQAKHPEAGLLMGFSAVILAGLLQIGFGLLKLGKYFILVPYSVISGFMTGIGVIIIVLQLGPLFGHTGSPSLLATLDHFPEWLPAISWHDLTLGLLAIAGVCLWPHRWNVWLPSPLLVLLLGTLCVIWLPEGAVVTIGAIHSAFPSLQWPTFSWDMLDDLLYAGVLLAVLGSIDSLLTSLVADNLTKQQHNSDRELIGQGIGNTVAGFFGGLPGAGATMRTVVNIRTGGRTGYSGMIHSLVLLAVMLGAGQYAGYIPLAVLAGILIKVGIDIIDWPYLRRLGKLPLDTAALMVLVLFLTVFVDLITAVLVGVFLSNMITVERLTTIQLDNVHFKSGLEADQSPVGAWLAAHNGRVALLSLAGPLSFGVGRGLRRSLAGHVSHQVIIVDLTGAQLVGTSTAMILDELIRNEQNSQRYVLLVGVSEQTSADLKRLGALQFLDEKHRFASLLDAMNYIDRDGLH